MVTKLQAVSETTNPDPASHSRLCMILDRTSYASTGLVLRLECYVVLRCVVPHVLSCIVMCRAELCYVVM